MVPHAGPRCWAGHRRDRALSKTLRPAQGLRCTIGAGYWSTPHSDHRQRRPGAVGPDPLRDQGELFEPMASDPTLWWTLDEKRGRRVLTLDSRVTGRLEARQPERTTSSNCVGVTDSPVLGLAARRSRRSRPFVLLSPGTEAPIRHPREGMTSADGALHLHATPAHSPPYKSTNSTVHPLAPSSGPDTCSSTAKPSSGTPGRSIRLNLS